MQTSTVTVTFKSGTVRIYPGKWDDAVERMQTILAYHTDEIASVVVTPDQPAPDSATTVFRPGEAEEEAGEHLGERLGRRMGQ